MITYAIETSEQELDLQSLLSRRLARCGCVSGIAASENGVTVTVQEGESVLRLAAALTEILCRDLLYFALARDTDALPLSLSEKQAVLTDALEQARVPPESAQRVRDGVLSYLMEARTLHLEGYLRFRMRGEVLRWRGCIERAMAERLLKREYAELMGLLGGFSDADAPRIAELSVCIHPDGSCTLTDDSDARIEYLDCSEDGILSMLSSMAPEKLVVYDLSEGAGRSLTEAIRRAFAGRVKIYR